MKKLLLPLLALAALAALALPARAQGTLPRPDPTVAEFGHGVKFTVAGYTGTEVLTNFPVLVRLKEYDSGTGEGIQGFQYSDFTRADYKDLCFVDMQTNGLPCEVDTWDASGESLVWVTLPRVTNGTEFVMWYHSSSVGSLVCNANAWDDYAGVWHMNESADGEVTIADATANELHATSTSGSYAQPDGRIGGARIPTKDGSGKTTERIEVNLGTNAKKAVVNGVNTDADHAFTVSMWIKPVKYSSFDGPNSAYLMSRKTADDQPYWAVQFHYDNRNGFKNSIHYGWIRTWRNEKGGDDCWHSEFDDSVIPLDASDCYGNWYKLDVVYWKTNVCIYVNGGGTALSSLTNVTTKSPANGSNKLFLTGTSVGSKARPFRGDLDEFRLRAGAMSADWVKADFDTVDNTSFLSVGTVQTVKVREIPVASFSLFDSGAAFATFSGVISSLGEEEATSGNVYYKVWPSSGSEPTSPDDGWQLLRSGLAANVAFTESVPGLTPGTAYSWKLYAKNDLGDATEEVAEGSFTTSGAGVAGVGGETYRVRDDYVHRFTVDDDDTTSYEFTPPSYVTTLRALVVAGGGAGGYDRGGGGGAGGLSYNAALALSGGTTYTVNVGTGGVSTASVDVRGGNGGDSSIVGSGVNLVVGGGGAGGNYGNNNSIRSGIAGGSGGGSASGGTSVGGATSGQGNKGGAGSAHEGFINGGGGGGASEAGGEAPTVGATHSGGGGGAGFATDISGENVYYAGGGGGGADVPEKNGKSNSPGRGGDGGGGDGGSQTVAASAGQDHLGGGGGGGYLSSAGGNGGSGVVILRYSVQGDGRDMTEPAIALESISRDDQTGVTTIGYRVAWAGYGYDYADVAVVWGFSKHDLSHTNAIAPSMIGRGTGTFTLPDQTKTVFVRVFATNAVAGALSTEILRIPFSNPEAPAVDLPVVSNIQGTGASFSAAVTGLGAGATRVQGVFQVCTDDDFEGTVLSFPAGQTLAEAGSFTATASGLSLRTTYYVRVSATNDVPAVFETEPVSFRTLAPGKPNGSVVTNLTTVASPPAECTTPVATDTTITAWGYLYSPGNNGASCADLRLEAATNANFKPVVAYTATETGVTQRGYRSFTLTDLEPETAYYLRLRMENDGQISDYSKVVGPFSTLASATMVELTFPSMPANVSVSSVTTNGVAVVPENGVYTVESGVEATVTFAAAPGYALSGASTATITVNDDTVFPSGSIPTATTETATLTIGTLPANVMLVSVTVAGDPVEGVNGVYTVYSNATATVTFAAAAGYRLVGDATVDVVVDGNKTLSGIPTAEIIPIPTATLTIPEPSPNVALVSVTTNDVAVAGNANVYTVFSNATVTVAFAADEGYWLVGNATVAVVVDGDMMISDMPTATPILPPTVSQSRTKVYARQTVTLTASATGATSYYWLKNGEQIEGGENGTLTVDWRKPQNNPRDTYRAVAVYSINELPVDSGPSEILTVENLPMGTVISVLGRPTAPPAPPPPHDYGADYLTFRVLSPGTICWKAFGSLTKTIEYQINDGEWTSITSTSDGATISVEKDDLVRFRGTNSAYATSKSAYSGFEGGTATYDIEGNIMSLLYGDNFAESTDLPNGSTYTFCSLFKKAPVISAEHLVLQATTLKNYCYRALFSYCETLTKAPELPAATLATGCYWYMFEHCAITEAPVLEATTLVAECYGHMFEGCGLLNKITCLATSGLGASKCLEGWVTNVAGDGAFVKAANVDWTTGASGIPTGWIVCEDVLLLPPEVSFFGDTIELECDTAGAEIHYRLGKTGAFVLYAQPISIVGDTVVEAYSTYQGHTSPTVTQTCVYVYETPFQRSNKDLPTWRYGGGTITTPYSVNATNGHSSSYAKGTFSFDTSVTLQAQQPTYLWFQHADQSADIYVDDVKVGTHWGGYNAFFFDISEYVHRGKNDIRVALCNTTRNALAPCAGDFNFNATLGNVKLFTSPVLPAMEYGYDGFHITSTVSASSATTNATIYVETKVPVGADLKCIVSDGSYAWTNTLASSGIKQTFTNTISNAHLWNGTLDPHLYTVTLEIYKDGDLYHKYERPYGFRYYSYVINETVNGQSYTGFLLNGQPYQLRGVCMHDDVEGKANALTDSDYDQEFAIIEELGCNFIRLAHYPHPKEVYDRCDQLGIIVQTEVPCVNKLQATLPDDYYTHLTTQYTEMVQQHYNHPCIVFWGLSNETTTDDKAFGKIKIEGYYDLIKKMDSERLVGYVMSHSWDNPSGYYNDPDVDWFGCNLYVGWYIDKTSNNPSSRLNTRLANTLTRLGKPLALSEYGCGGTQHCHSTNFLNTTTSGNNPRHDIEYQMWLHEGHIAAIRNFPQLLFTGQWQLFDIAVSSRKEGYTECLDGENATTNEDLKYLNNKGLVERDHVTKKDTFYLYKAEWNTEDKFVHICGKDYTKTTGRALKCYTNDGDTLSLYFGDSQTPRETVPVVDHIAVFPAMDFPTGVEIRVEGATTSDTVTFQ